MQTRTGRKPKFEKPMSTYLFIRLTPADEKLIVEKARQNGYNNKKGGKSAFARDLLLERLKAQ